MKSSCAENVCASLSVISLEISSRKPSVSAAVLISRCDQSECCNGGSRKSAETACQAILARK